MYDFSNPIVFKSEWAIPIIEFLDLSANIYSMQDDYTVYSYRLSGTGRILVSRVLMRYICYNALCITNIQISKEERRKKL